MLREKKKNELSTGQKKLSLCSSEIDCTIAVMLKIIDGKCKMPPSEKTVMEMLYDQFIDTSGLHLDHSYRQLITEARSKNTPETRNKIYELRVLAETMISRPVMKQFKARLREEGFLSPK